MANRIIEFQRVLDMDHALLSAAVAMQECGNRRMETKLSQFLELSENIHLLMLEHDDERFNLVDYLEACLSESVSGPAGTMAWPEFAKQVKKAVESDNSRQKNHVYDMLNRAANTLRREQERTDMEKGGFA